MSTSAINTNVRLFDLVRYMRRELHAADLITDEEYSWLCMEASMANDPKGGSPSPRRLEDYDAMRKDLTALRDRLAVLENELAGDMRPAAVLRRDNDELRARLAEVEAERDGAKKLLDKATELCAKQGHEIAVLRAYKGDLAAAEREREDLRQLLNECQAANRHWMDAEKKAREKLDAVIRERDEARAAFEVECGWTNALSKDNGLLIEAADKTRAGRKCIDLQGRNEKLTEDNAALRAVLEKIARLEDIRNGKVYRLLEGGCQQLACAALAKEERT